MAVLMQKQKTRRLIKEEEMHNTTICSDRRQILRKKYEREIYAKREDEQQ